MDIPNDSGPPQEILARIAANIGGVMAGQSASIRKLLAAFTAGGHVLLEDNPGTGKTTMSKALARSIGAEFKRVQFTSDLLPSDIIGVSVFDPKDQSFHFHKGPVFTQILLADEINRASPRTQSALLEAMAEHQVSVEGKHFDLGEMFFVLATQNPVEFRGTYPLPEAQMDRFALRLSLGYLEPDAEVRILSDQQHGHPLDGLSACVSLDEALSLRRALCKIKVSAEIKRYIVDIVRATRTAPQVQLGAGPRASLALTHLAQALALADGGTFVRPEHVQELAIGVIAHRLVLSPEARFGGVTQENVVRDVLKDIAVPA